MCKQHVVGSPYCFKSELKIPTYMHKSHFASHVFDICYSHSLITDETREAVNSILNLASRVTIKFFWYHVKLLVPAIVYSLPVYIQTCPKWLGVVGLVFQMIIFKFVQSFLPRMSVNAYPCISKARSKSVTLTLYNNYFIILNGTTQRSGNGGVRQPRDFDNTKSRNTDRIAQHWIYCI
jgi:hypothetical protein